MTRMIEPGLLIGSHRIARHIASGGMGAVYEARHERLQCRAAVKVLHAESVHNPIALARFRNEATAAGMVEHPHVVQLFDTGELSSGRPYLIMNFLPGETLATFLAQLRDMGGRPELATVLDIGAQMACALAAVHLKGLVHRDVKPSNIILVPLSGSRGGSARIERWHSVLIDFSVAKLPDLLPDASPLTRPGQWIGTKQYMAPEQVSDGAAVDGKVDVYALGAVLYEMLMGQPPPGWQQGQRTDGTGPCRSLVGDSEFREELTSLIEQMLSQAPESRPAADYVEQILRRLAVYSRSTLASPASVAPATADDVPRRSTAVRIGLGLGIGMTVLVLGVVARCSHKPRHAPLENPLPTPPADVTNHHPVTLPIAGGLRWQEVAVQGGPHKGAADEEPANLSGIWGSASDDIWIVGRQNGALLHYDGERLTMPPTNFAKKNLSLFGIWGSGPRDVWAVGGNGAILHYDGKWQTAPALTSSDLLAIGGSSAQDILAVGRGVILHYNGKDWTPVEYREPYSIHGVWYAGPNDAWMVGYNDFNHGVTLHWDGNSVRLVVKNELRMRDVWGDQRGGLWAVGSRTSPNMGIVLRFERSQWHQVARVPSWLTVIWGTSPDDIWATGEEGVMLHYDGTQWSETSVPKAHYRGLWGLRGDLWAVGERGMVLHLADWQPTRIAVGHSNNLNDVWMHGDSTGWAVGSAGLILGRHHDGAGWAPWPLNTTRSLNSVHGCSGDDVWAVGDGGISLHFDGKRWIEVATGTSARLTSVHCRNQVAWAVGASGTMLTYKDGAWHALATGIHDELRSVWNGGPDDLWIVGRQGVVLRLSAGRRQKLAALEAVDYWRVWGSSPDDVWLAAEDGSLTHYQSGELTMKVQPVAGAIRALSGTSARDIWAAGRGGTLLHFDGVAWRALRSGTTDDILGIASDPSGSTFLVGERGGIWH